MFAAQPPGRSDAAGILPADPAPFGVTQIAIDQLGAVRQQQYRRRFLYNLFKRAVGDGNLVAMFQGNPELGDLDFFQGIYFIF